MAYYFNLETISIDQYKEILRTADLIPSWMIVKDNINENLDCIKKQNIQNLAELQKALKSKGKIEEFSQNSGLPEDYLNILRRVINSYQPKPNRFKDFPNLTEEIVARLEKLGYKNSLHLYPEILTAARRQQLANQSGLSENEIMLLTRLTDLSRIRWVNHTFAYVLLEAGYDSTEKIAQTDYLEMYESIKKMNQERQIYKANIGPNDMKMVIESAASLDLDIEYE